MLPARPATGIFPPEIIKAAPYFAFALAVLLAYGNVYDNAFVDDDKVLILRNVFLQDWHYLPALLTTTVTAGAGLAGGFYRPVQMLIYFLIYQAFGASSFVLHFLSLALHIANAGLLYRLVTTRLGFNPRATFLAVMLWALHPVQVEGIAYISAMADPLYVCFDLIALLILLPDFTLRRVIKALPFFILGLLSKEDAITLPLLVMSCLFFLSNRRFDSKTYKNTWPLWAAAIVYALIHRYGISFGDYKFYPDNLPYTSGIGPRIYTCLATLPQYLGFLVWPAHLHFDRNLFPMLDPWNWPVAEGAAIILAAALQIALAHSRGARAVSWGLLWCASAHVLHTGIPVPLNSMIMEHWLYLPSAGLFLGFAQGVAGLDWRRLNVPASCAAGALALLFGFLTWQQNIVWHDEEGFYLNIFANGEPSLEAHDNLGSVYTERGDYDKAIEQFQMVISLSHDQNAPADYNLAVAILLQQNDSDAATMKAIGLMKRAIQIEPNFYAAADKLSILYGRLGDEKPAEFWSQRAKTIRDQITHGAP